MSLQGRPDPVAQAVIAGLLRRAEAQTGPVRALLLHRAGQLQALQGGGHGDDNTSVEAPVAAPPALAALPALARLVDRLGRAGERPAAAQAFQGTWARLRTQQRLRQALAHVPAQAGPLHSSHLVHRALQTLSKLSPAYVDAMLPHLDTLLWLDQASGGGSVHKTGADVVNASQQGSDLRRRRTKPRG